MDDGIRMETAGDGRFAVIIDGDLRGYLRKTGENGVLWMPRYGRFTLRLSWPDFCRLTRHG